MYLKMRKRIPKIVSISIGAALVLAACGDDGAGGGPSDSGSDELTYWSMWEQSEPDAQSLQKVIDAFEDETGITVNVEWQGRDVMNKLLAAQNTDDVPDLVNQSTERVGAAMVSTDQFTDLSDLYETNVYGEDITIAEAIPEEYRAATTTEDGVPFLVPQFVHAYTLWYDGAAMPDVAANPPETWAEFRSVLDEAKASGRQPLALDADIGSYVTAWPGIALVRVLGAGGLNALVADESGAGWDNPDIVEAISEIADLAQGGYFLDGYSSSKWPAIERKWFDGESDFLLMGSWVPLEADTKEWAPEGFELRTFNFPAFGEDRSVPIQAYGFAIPKKAEHVDAAEKFITFMMNKETLANWAKVIPLLPPRTDVEVAPSLEEVYELLKDATLSSPLDDVQAEYPDYYTKVFEPLARDLLLGNVSGEEFVDNIKNQQIEYWELNG